MSDATPGEAHLRVGEPEESAVGVPGVAVSMRYALTEMGTARSVRTLLRVNQTDGFDCPSCAWGDPAAAHRKHAEFCENGAKAVAWEATRKRVDAAFFAAHPVAFLREQTDHWLEANGRLIEPMYLAEGAGHYVPVGWDEALRLIAGRLRALDNPNRALFYTSGRASNEAAFAYQLLARRLGTNNLPDCSNMCHESSGAALTETIGIGKGTVTLEDISDHAELIVVVGQNPGTNHPRMLGALEEAKQRGAKIVAVNPLPEAGLMRFKNPQKARGLAGHGTKLADRFLRVRVNGDLALLQGNIGRPGAGPCPVRGHSNVQGDRTMGIWEKMPDAFLDRLRDEFGFEPPRAHGLDVVDSIRAVRDGNEGMFHVIGPSAPPGLVTGRVRGRRCPAGSPGQPPTAQPAASGPGRRRRARRCQAL
jgi:anaerobic selenocysteine-containing dehydrogenase